MEMTQKDMEIEDSQSSCLTSDSINNDESNYDCMSAPTDESQRYVLHDDTSAISFVINLEHLCNVIKMTTMIFLLQCELTHVGARTLVIQFFIR